MKVKKLVIDTAAFLKNVPLWEYGEEFYTVPEVIAEIKDRQTKHLINSLPIELKFQSPSPNSIKFILDFTKKTGDYTSLSLADIKVLALTYELEVQAKGSNEHLRQAPLECRTEINVFKPRSENSKPINIEGFYMPKESNEANKQNIYNLKGDIHSIDTEEHSIAIDNKERLVDNKELLADNKENSVDNEEHSVNNEEHSVDNEEHSVDNEEHSVDNEEHSVDNEEHSVDSEENSVDSEENSVDNEEHSVDNEENSVDNEEYSFDNEEHSVEEDFCNDDDEDGWITPSNLKNIRNGFPSDEALEESCITACITADYAVQNTLKHIGLKVMGVDGKLIYNLKTFILRCFACYKTTDKMYLLFCKHCGNKTLKKVSVTLNPDGTQKIWISTRRPINIRGTKFSLPKPRGGKHAINPILVADQREAQQRASKLARMRNDPMQEDYGTGLSPFIQRDIYSRSAQLGITSGKKQHRGLFYWEQRNPNVPMKKKSGRKK